MAFVYILANKWHTVLYVGVTNNLGRRLHEHKNKMNSGSFSARYNVDQLIYFEQSNDMEAAIEREKEIKKWRREKKVRLINELNPDWKDLYNEIDEWD
ncbi:GIY-YIG nuclease family protein [Candidatus Peregrinibacteria bacterium]|nr:MAG: GIY-YIG nuclease family protein [Candidatus Peregrinibacteria bacterium]